MEKVTVEVVEVSGEEAEEMVVIETGREGHHLARQRLEDGLLRELLAARALVVLAGGGAPRAGRGHDEEVVGRRGPREGGVVLVHEGELLGQLDVDRHLIRGRCGVT